MDLVIVCTLATSFIFGVTPLFERILLKGSEFPLAVGTFARVFPALLASLLFIIATGDIRRLSSMGTKEYLGFGLLGILGSLVGPALLFVAYRQPSGNISFIGPLLASFPLFTVFAGYLFLGEAISRTQLAGMAMIITGAVLLSYR